MNGVKYQVGGDLSSFFIEDNESHYNCVYVALTLPQNEYNSKDYVVSEIEYIANTFINPDGTDEFMNANNTVSIGLPYTSQNPIAENFEATELLVNGATISFDLTDEKTLATLSGGWLGIAVYDGSNILLNQKAKVGSNQIKVDSLAEEASYTV